MDSSSSQSLQSQVQDLQEKLDLQRIQLSRKDLIIQELDLKLVNMNRRLNQTEQRLKQTELANSKNTRKQELLQMQQDFDRKQALEDKLREEEDRLKEMAKENAEREKANNKKWGELEDIMQDIHKREQKLATDAAIAAQRNIEFEIYQAQIEDQRQLEAEAYQAQIQTQIDDGRIAEMELQLANRLEVQEQNEMAFEAQKKRLDAKEREFQATIQQRLAEISGREEAMNVKEAEFNLEQRKLDEIDFEKQRQQLNVDIAFVNKRVDQLTIGKQSLIDYAADLRQQKREVEEFALKVFQGAKTMKEREQQRLEQLATEIQNELQVLKRIRIERPVDGNGK